MFAKKSLKSQLIITFILIVISSIIATIGTYYVGYVIYTKIQLRRIYPANYYEKKIPDIEAYIRERNVDVLDKKEKGSIEQMIPLQGIKYQVMNENGDMIYGTDKDKIIHNKEDLYNKINKTFGTNGRYIKIIPLFDSQGRLMGAVSLSYMLKLHYANTSDKLFLAPILFLILFSPFIYIIVFTLLFSKRTTDNIGKPINLLIKASEKVKEKNLDFDIDYYADNELGKLCQTFNEMKNELKESLISQWRGEQERQEMVQAIAHDLKTPLSTILVYTDSLLEEEDKNLQKRKRYLHIIRNNASKGAQLIKEMLYAAELEAFSMDLNVTQVDINNFLLKKREEYEMIGKNKNIELKVDIIHENNKGIGCPVDMMKLERILDNIIFNSMRYTPRGGIIEIKAYITNERVNFTIGDSGKGFTNKDLSNLFNKFYKGDESRSSKNGNAGLGLYIAKKLVEIHKGEISAFNRGDKGACVEFSLPFIKKIN